MGTLQSRSPPPMEGCWHEPNHNLSSPLHLNHHHNSDFQFSFIIAFKNLSF